MSFKTQIEDLIGSVGDDDLITTSIQDIGAEIISVLPPQKLLAVAKTTAITSSGLTTAGKKVLAVDKSDLPAKEIRSIEKARYNDTASIYAASDTNPIYYIEDEKVYVNGAAGSGATSGHLHYVPKIPTSDGSTAIVEGGSTVTNFPQEAERLLVLGGAVRCLQRLMADKTSDLPTDISDVILPVSPVPPVLTSNSVTFDSTAPVYNGPVVAPAFGTVDTFISTDEDVELASVKIQEINSQIGEYQANIQNELNVFNDANVEYQANLQIAIQNAQLSSSDDAQLLQKYSSEVQDYQSEVSAIIQKFNADIQNYNAKIQKHSTDYQWKQGQYKQLNTEYNQGLQLLISGKTLQQQGA
tara:strand:- start:2347 stop:3414 length:1068 start_codon:yes stop_codon:yes gene_type:complete